MMTAVHCLRAEFLIERRSAGLSAAEGLLLEEHLAGCERCSTQARLLFGLRALSQQHDASLDTDARERALRGALAGVGAERTDSEKNTGWLRPAAFGFACAAALAIGLGLYRAREQQSLALAPLAPSRLAAPAITGDRVLAGRIEREGRPLGAGEALSESSSWRAPEGATVALAHAQVELRPGTAFRWHAEARELELTSGSVVAEVDPDTHRSFVVATPSFSVHVLGTRFEVSLERVSVTRGRVRVVGSDGAVAATLAVGETYQLHATKAEAQTPTVARTTSRAASARKPAAPSNQPVAVPGSGPAPTAPAPAVAPDSAALLAAARTELAARHVDTARQKVDAALAGSPARSLRAEALSLRAECALIAGDVNAAVESYLGVARAFADLPAGENALFAAARLEANRGQNAAAAQQFEQYLARYPHGRFVKEAGSRLRQLNAVLDHAP